LSRRTESARTPDRWDEPEDVFVSGDRATIRWRYRFGEGEESSVRGVNLMHVRDGKIVEALGYVKAVKGVKPPFGEESEF
jgi:ketosteroid isomerase-like protein